MKKYLPILALLGILISSFAFAETVTLTGQVTKIEVASFTIVKNLNFFQRLTGIIRRLEALQPITINVTSSTKFYLRTSKTAGFTEGSFNDLKEKDRVVVTADKTNDVYNALEVKITGRFIPFPRTIPEIKQCQTDADCTWCGMSCVNKTELAGKACPQVTPREGTACQCVNNCCMVVPLTGPTSPSTTLVSHDNTITINRALTLGLIQDLPDKKMIQVIDSNLQNLYRIIITPQTKLKIGSITEGGDWLNIGLPKLNAEPKTWYDLKWSEFPKEGSAIIKVDGIIKDKTCYIYVDADTVYFYSVNVDPGCPSS